MAKPGGLNGISVNQAPGFFMTAPKISKGVKI